MAARSTMVIVGASLAGAKAAETLRAEGFDGRVLLLGEEPDRPYERPPLSKDVLRGESDRSKAMVHPAGFYAEQEIELRTGTPVESIDPAGSTVTIAGGERVAFDRLLIATGSAPRRLDIPGADLPGVHVLRTLPQADALRQDLEHAGHAVIIGAGWIGSEVAASARTMGVEVTLLEAAELPLERVLGADLGRLYRDIHVDHGVRYVGGARVAALEGGARVERVRMADGTAIDCDVVLIGVGARPRTELAEAAGLAVDNGILVSETMETSVPTIFAAGDVANAWHPFYQGRIRVEHWANALHQGPAAALAMLGRGVPYDRLPYFYSDQYDVGMEYTGHAPRFDEVRIRGDVKAREIVAFWLDGGRVVAGMNVNVWDVVNDVQALIRSGARVEPARLVDPSVPIAELAAA